MRFIILDDDQFYLKGTDNRFIHLATVGFSVREFLVFQDSWTSSVYIEEVTGGSLTKIEDQSLWKALTQFVNYHGLNKVEGT